MRALVGVALAPGALAAAPAAPPSTGSFIVAALRRKAIKGKGNEHAQVLLGFVYQRGWFGVEANDVQALCWFRQAAARDNPTAQRQLARAYGAGIGTRVNPALSLAWQQRAAAGGRGGSWWPFLSA
jgi:TPR repeat protein